MQTTTEAQPRATVPQPHRPEAELEKLAHAVSHDLTQRLTTIAGFSRLLISRYELELDAKSREYLDFIVKGAADMQGMIDGLVGSLRGASEERPSASRQSASRHAVAA